MENRLASLERDLADVRASLSGASGLSAMSDSGLLDATDALGRLVRSAEAVLSSVAGEIARRSPAQIGKDGLAKRQGFHSPAKLVAAATGGAVAAATRMVKVGEATSCRQSLAGEELPPAHPHVAESLTAGHLSVESASAITAMLDRVAPRADPGAAESVERVLVERAAELPHEMMVKIIGQAEARLDQDGIAPREEQLFQERSVRIREDAQGRVKLSAVLDAESGALVKTAVESLVTGMIRSGGGGDGAQVVSATGGGTAAASGVNAVVHAEGDDSAARTPAGSDGAGPALPERRTIAQMQADALAMIARHVLGCSRAPSSPAVTVVVRTELSALTEGTGHAEIDGMSQPVSAGTARRLAASSGLIPQVFDGDSVPLDLGRDARLFSRAQRLALYERDGGCACCGLDVAYTEAHHIRWWQRDTGPTDLDNGVLLCPPCHRRTHEDDWQISVREKHVWFVPPPHVDPDRRPRLGGKARFGFPETVAA